MSQSRVLVTCLTLLSAVPFVPATAPAAAPAAAPAPAVRFEVHRNKVLVPVRVGGSRPLRLILDSGMGFEGVLLFRPSLRDSIGAGRLASARIAGAGGGPPSEAFVADSLTLDVGGVRIGGQRVIILADTAMARGPNDGVIGYSLLGRYALELDYGRQAITLHDSASFRPPPGWTAVPLTFNDRNWPFLEVAAAVKAGPLTTYKVYLDCASSETIEFLTRPGMRFEVPAGAKEVVLGRGLSGPIGGKRAEIARLAIGGHELRDVTAAFTPAEIRSKAQGADAVLSNGALCRFDVVFDYARKRLLVKPNAHRPDALD